MRDAPPHTQGYFLLLVQEKVAKEKDTPDGANAPAHPRFRDPALILRGILPRRSGADILSAPPSGRLPGTLRGAGAPYGGPKTSHPMRPASIASQSLFKSALICVICG